MPEPALTDQTLPKDWLPLFMWMQFFYNKQLEFINSEAWKNFFISANGTGKSLLIYWAITAYALGTHPKQIAKPPLTIRVAIPSFDNVRDVALVKLFEPHTVKPKGIEIGPIMPKSMVKKHYSKDFPGMDLKNGSVVRWVTDRQGWQMMRGPEQDILVMDEEVGERFFDENVRGMRSAKGGGKILGGLTPPYEEGRGPTWTKEQIFEASDEDPDIAVFRACMADNPNNDDLFIKRWSKGKTPEQIRVQIYGEYPSWGKIIHYPFQNTYWNAEKCEGHVLPMDTPFPENWEVDWLMSFDWHPSKPTAAVWAWKDSDGNVIFYDELDPQLAENKEIPDLAEIYFNIEGFPRHNRKFRRWQDPSAKTKYKALIHTFNAWDEFRKNGIVTTEGKNRDPEVGIGYVNDYLKGNTKDHPRIFIRENCINLRRAMGNHYWIRSESGKAEPDRKWKDFCICVRYIIQDLGTKYRDRSRRRDWPLTSYSKPKDKGKVIDLSKWI